MSWMTARATLKMTETELTRRHSVRTVTHINTLPRGDLNFREFILGLARVPTNNSHLRSVNALGQRHCHFPACVLSHAATILSARSSRGATRADSGSDLVHHVNALADAPNGRRKSSLGASTGPRG